MSKRIIIVGLLVLLSLTAVIPAFAGGNGRGSGPTVLVENQGLYFDSIVVADLPMEGQFQQLFPVSEGVLRTEFGPGDVGYLGGRWWIDVNGNEEMDAEDMFFLCPLLGPGRDTL